MLAFGARVLAVQGSYDDACDLCLAASDEFGWFNRSTGYNPFTREGKKTCAYEIWQDLGGRAPDRVVVREVKASTVADSISVDRPRDGLAAVKAVIQSGGEAVTVPDQEILAAIPEMARTTGVFPEPAAATPWAAVKQMVREERITTDELLVCIVTGSGLKDITNARSIAGEPLLIEPSLKAVRDAVKT